MKCPVCGFENKDDARFCVHCGRPLVTKEVSEEAVHLAFLYTASKAAAVTIAAEAGDEVQLRRKAVEWIRAHEPDLFHDPVQTDNDPVLESVKDWDDALRDMDYEERICTLMHVHEGLSVEETASQLQISSDMVRGELQKAYRLLHAKKAEDTIPLEKPKPEKKKRKISIRRVRMVLIGALAVIVTILLGVKLGVRNYAASQYQKGTDALKQGNYEDAEKALTQARRFGYEDDIEKQLGNMYAAEGRTEDAVSAWQTWYDTSQDDDGVRQSLIRGYEQLADQKLGEGSTSEALEWLEKEEKINNAQFVKIRINAVRNGGLYRDQDGNEFNSFGQPLRLHTDSCELVITYDEDHHLSEISGVTDMNSTPVVFSDFDFSGNVNDEMEWSHDEEGLQWRNNRQTYDEDGNLQSEQIRTGSLNYTRTWTSDSSYTDSQGNHVSVKKKKDKQGRVTEETETMRGKTILTRKYKYEGTGKLFSEMTAANSDDPDPTWLAPADCTVESSDADRVHMYRADIMNEQGSTIGTKWYVPYNGNITVYSAD